MAFIETIEPDAAEGALKELYDEVARSRGSIANVFRVHSLHPEAMRDHLQLYMTLLYGRSGITRAQREMIAVAVSAANRCDYCVVHHSEALARYLRDEALVEAIARDYRQATLEAKERAMLDYAVKLTRASETVAERDVETLRTAGFLDGDILDIALIASYFNFVNRVIHGLGVAVEGADERTYGY